MRFDVSKIKPGWSLSKIKTYECPLRFARLYIEGRKEPRSDVAIVGSLAAVAMAEARLRYLESGADVRLSGHLDRVVETAAPEEGATEDHVAQAMELVYRALNHHWHDLMPERGRVARYWIEERLAFDREWRRIRFSPEDAKWWGSERERERTWFRCVPDFAWLDTDGTLHVEDDKTGWAKPEMEQTQAYGFALSKLLEEDGKKPELLYCRYNLLAQGKQVQAAATPADVAGFPKWLQAQVDRIVSTTDWRPVLGKQCEWCGFVEECPAHQKTAAQLQTVDPDSFGAITTREQAIRGALWLMAAERCVAIAKEKLREYVEQNGPVEIPETGKELAIRPVTEKEAPAGEVLGTLAALGVPKDVILEALTLRPKHADAILRRQWPLSGKGVTADVKAANREARAAAEAALENLWTETPRKGRFGIFEKAA